MKTKHHKGFIQHHFSPDIIVNGKHGKGILITKVNKKMKKNSAGFTSVGSILSGKMKDKKLEQSFYKHQVLKVWEEVASGFMSQTKDLVKAVDLKNGVLVIACLSKELAYQIKLLSQRIINEINKLIGKSVVYAIFVES